MPAISEELLAKFLKGLCTEEEAAIVEEHFQQHPEDVYLLDEYEAAGEGAPLPEGYREEMLEAILSKTGDGSLKGKGKVVVIRSWAAAACMVLLVAGWWVLHQESQKREKAPMRVRLAVWVGKHNAENKKMRVLLPDSSETVLSPGATIQYRKDFGQYGSREVRVEGQASFMVIKDKQLPFIVYCEGIRTTVLGTIFEVTAEKGSDQIRVKLLEGKLIVGLDSLSKDSSRKYYLSPGEELVYGKWNKSFVVRPFNIHIGGGYATSRVNRLPGVPDSLSNWYMFNNQALGEVFDQLSVLYNVDIQYSHEDLQNKYFIGKLEKKDSLSKIMRDIALLNHLSVTVVDGRYIVRKRKP